MALLTAVNLGGLICRRKAQPEEERAPDEEQAYRPTVFSSFTLIVRPLIFLSDFSDSSGFVKEMSLFLEKQERRGLTKAVLRQWIFLIPPLSHAYVRTAFGESSPFPSALILQEP